MTFPAAYAEDAYVGWHERRFAADVPLASKLADHRASLKEVARGDLKFLATLLESMGSYCRGEMRVAHRSVEFDIPLSEAVLSGRDAQYDRLFKSVSSTLNKLWRKNQADDPTTCLANYRERVGDLIRTEVVAPTLATARFFAERMNHLPDVLHDRETRAEFVRLGTRVTFEPEMKMASGYFAYHGQVVFATTGLTVEVQAYSNLTSVWRKLSHGVYDRVRGHQPAVADFARPETRLVSLGHLLHLAECEIELLERELPRSG